MAQIAFEKGTKKIYLAWGDGTTIEEAIQHHNFWCAPGEKIGEKFEILETAVIGMTDEYPYDAEDTLKRAFADKEKTIKKIEAGPANPQDKEDLRAVIENEAPWNFWTLDTLCRDRLWDVMK